MKPAKVETGAPLISALSPSDGERVAEGRVRGKTLYGVCMGCFWDITLAIGRLVDHQPVVANIPDGLREFFAVDRFHHVAVHAQSVALDVLDFLARGGQDNHRDGLGPV